MDNEMKDNILARKNVDCEDLVSIAVCDYVKEVLEYSGRSIQCIPTFSRDMLEGECVSVSCNMGAPNRESGGTIQKVFTGTGSMEDCRYSCQLIIEMRTIRDNQDRLDRFYSVQKVIKASMLSGFLRQNVRSDYFAIINASYSGIEDENSDAETDYRRIVWNVLISISPKAFAYGG